MATVLRDGVWGDIPLSRRELAVIDTPAFQRLRRVRQLGFTDLVFPGAHHSRFEHSLGVFHLAGLALDRLRGADGVPPISDEDGRAFLAASLLHDVGHYPFSHAVEELEVEQIRRHEDIARDVIRAGPVADAIRDEWDVDPTHVAALVAGPAPRGEAGAVLRAALDSGLDVDKLDYLVRDARGANVPYGLVDVQRLIGSLTVWRGELAVEAKGITALQSLVFAKHLMFATVYWHHACRAAVAMLLRALQEALDAGLRPDLLERADDGQLVAFLRADHMPPLVRELASRIEDRRLYKRAIEIGIDHPAFDRLERLWFRPAERRSLENEWARAAGGPPGSVLLDIPEPKRIAVDLPVIVADGEASEWDLVSGLATDDLDRFQRWVRKLRVFVGDASIRAALGDDLLA
jgi:HD superfamily phosphohydrolase